MTQFPPLLSCYDKTRESERCFVKQEVRNKGKNDLEKYERTATKREKERKKEKEKERPTR